MSKRLLEMTVLVLVLGCGVVGVMYAAAAEALPPGVPAGAKPDADGSYRLTIDMLPAAVKAAFEKQAGGNPIRAISLEIHDGKFVYDCDVFIDGKKHEVITDADGNLKTPPLPSAAAGAAKPAAPAKPAAEPKFQETFDVDKAALADKGTAKYFILEPGFKRTFKSGIDTLVITVLDETKMVDGVKCRIMEERETENGKLAEISRNYFAMDPKTGDVYYFGEAVDTYDAGGKVTGHGGSWESGKDGARFGLMMPGRPMLGARYYQEFAPKLAMDRAEIVSLTGEIKVPAGTFKNCVRTKESSSLESGDEEKVYAPEVGMVKDAEFELALVEKPKVEPPPAVTKAFKAAFPNAEIEKLDAEQENGVMVYDYEFREGTLEKETDIAGDGTILETTLVIDLKALPPAVLKAVRKGADGGKLGRTEQIEINYETRDGKVIKLPKTVTHYSVEYTKGDTSGEVTVDAEGKAAQ